MIQAACGISLLVPLASVLAAPEVPLLLRALVVAVWVGAILRPHAAILALAVLLPLGSTLLAAFDTAPVHYTEAIAIAGISGLLMAAAGARRAPLGPQRPAAAPPAVLFGAIVLASAAVVLGVTQIGTHTPWLFLRSFAVFLWRDYLVGPSGEFDRVGDAARLLEGMALLFLVARHERDGVRRPPQLITAIAAGALLTAGLTAWQAAGAAASADTLQGLLTALLRTRTSAHVADVNAAGSYFAMATLVAAALAYLGRRRSSWWPFGLVLLLSAVWITGSRMAAVATIGALVGLAVTIGPLRPRHWSPWAIGAAALATIAVLGALAVGLDPRPSGSRGVATMMNLRAAFVVTGLRMIASAPVFGVGIGRYFDVSGGFMPTSIYWLYFHENAHNNFLQIAGELGLTGLAAFLWLLGAVALRLIRGLRAYSQDWLLGGALAGLLAFVATWITSHPMLVTEVAYPFWMLAGGALARADGDAQPQLVPPAPAPAAARAGGRWLRLATAAIVVALAASVAPRVRSAEAAIDWSKQTFGFYDWEKDGERRFRWSSRRATFFIPPAARELELPLRALHLASNKGPTEVSIAIGGRVLHRTRLGDDWVTVRLRLPPEQDASRYQRIDVISAPAWSPAELNVGDRDVRILGVQVGEPVVR